MRIVIDTTFESVARHDVDVVGSPLLVVKPRRPLGTVHHLATFAPLRAQMTVGILTAMGTKRRALASVGRHRSLARVGALAVTVALVALVTATACSDSEIPGVNSVGQTPPAGGNQNEIPGVLPEPTPSPLSGCSGTPTLDASSLPSVLGAAMCRELTEISTQAQAGRITADTAASLRAGIERELTMPSTQALHDLSTYQWLSPDAAALFGQALALAGATVSAVPS